MGSNALCVRNRCQEVHKLAASPIENFFNGLADMLTPQAPGAGPLEELSEGFEQEETEQRDMNEFRRGLIKQARLRHALKFTVVLLALSARRCELYNIAAVLVYGAGAGCIGVTASKLHLSGALSCSWCFPRRWKTCRYIGLQRAVVMASPVFYLQSFSTNVSRCTLAVG